MKADDTDCDRYAAVRLKFNDNEISYFEEALAGYENLENVEEGDFLDFMLMQDLDVSVIKNYMIYIVILMKSG